MEKQKEQADRSVSLANPSTKRPLENRHRSYPSRLVGGGFFLSNDQGGSMSTKALETDILTEEERLETMLLRRLGNRVRDFRVILLPAGLILQGHTATYHAKQLAQHAAMELANLPIVANEIEVL